MKKIIGLFIIIYSFIFVILYVDYGTVVVLAMICALPIFLKVITLRMKYNVKLNISPVIPFSEQGREVEIPIKIQNSSKILPITNGVVYIEYKNLFSKEKVTNKIQFYMDTDQTISLSVKWKPAHCGRLRIRIKSVRLYDYFGVFYGNIHIKKRKQYASIWESDVIIMPAYIELPFNFESGYRESDEDSNIYSKHKAGEDPAEIFSIREYREGDKLHKIHWNLSYKKRQFMMKEYSLPLICAASIVLDFSLPGKGNRGHHYADAMLKIAFSLSFAFLQKKQLHYIVWHDAILHNPVRKLVEREEDLYEVFQQILTSQKYIGKERITDQYIYYFQDAKQYIVYYVTPVKEIREDELLMQFACERVECFMITTDKDKEIQREHLGEGAVNVTQVNAYRINEGIQEGLFNE